MSPDKLRESPPVAVSDSAYEYAIVKLSMIRQLEIQIRDLPGCVNKFTIVPDNATDTMRERS
jgi:hypothetical protein